eukprot:TRINITY_DN91490_c0_g1_i1.p1 TRINITY_DN91490_c0_g1~~TRINITY_DN91490_c0_g1_i1.p1  ORF type:complete len:142 (+),score=17.66 TRINITY_DN91490_c0_g1_i1:33-458(+)
MAFRLRLTISLAALALLAGHIHGILPATSFVGPAAQRSTNSVSIPSHVRQTPWVMTSRHAQGGAGDAAESDGSWVNTALLIFGVVFGLYAAFLVSYGWLDCTGGDYSPFSITKCAVVDTLFGADDLGFQFNCKFKLIPACQ